MKIRISMNGKTLAVEAGENANFLFLKIANQLLCNGIKKSEVEIISEKLKENSATEKKDMTQSGVIKAEKEIREIGGAKQRKRGHRTIYWIKV